MDPLLFSIAVLLVVSGAVKARASSRLALGTPLLALGELALALVLAAWAVAGPEWGASRLFMAGGAVFLIIASSLHHSARVRERRRRRSASEGKRLEAYLRMAEHRDHDRP